MVGFHWLVAYPKSGHTWLRISLWCLLHGRPPDLRLGVDFAQAAGARDFFESLLNVSSEDLTEDEIDCLRPRAFEREAALSPEPGLRKVHEAWRRTPTGEPLFPPAITLGIVYIVRDPRDVAVSLAHHLGVTLDGAIAFLADPQATLAPRNHPQFQHRLLDWSSHVESWLDSPGPRPLLVRYEDRIADPAGQLAEVARHLGWQSSPEAVAAATAASQFEVLRAAEDQQGFGEKLTTEERFFRRGKAGGWRDTLSSAQVSRIEKDHGRVMARLGYV